MAGWIFWWPVKAARTSSGIGISFREDRSRKRALAAAHVWGGRADKRNFEVENLRQTFCPLNTVEGHPEGDPILAYAPHGRLAERLEQSLTPIGITYRRDAFLFTIEAPGPEERLRLVSHLRSALNGVEQRLIRACRGGWNRIFAAPNLNTFAQIVETEWYDEAMAGDQFTTYFQPIFDTARQRNFAHECLIRLESSRIFNGAEIVQAAVLRDDLLGFDTYARVRAVQRAAPQIEPGTLLFINFFPSAVYDPEACMVSTVEAIQAARIPACDVVFEIVESDHIADAGHTRIVCDYFRRHGFRYAIDDLGSGTHTEDDIAALRPDFVKIDKSVVWNLGDPVKLDIARRAVRLSERYGAQVIAEGIESAQMASDVRKLGIDLMQGYFFGKPRPTMETDSGAGRQQDLLRLSGAIASSEPVPAPAFAADSPRTLS
jgi:EAL domain-containing protein (putative c-di-GMP-specific phosphodiesterase class I)